jgi:hypothetical protein
MVWVHATVWIHKLRAAERAGFGKLINRGRNVEPQKDKVQQSEHKQWGKNDDAKQVEQSTQELHSGQRLGNYWVRTAGKDTTAFQKRTFWQVIKFLINKLVHLTFFLNSLFLH